jgi:hypothetical protein
VFDHDHGVGSGGNGGSGHDFEGFAGLNRGLFEIAGADFTADGQGAGEVCGPDCESVAQGSGQGRVVSVGMNAFYQDTGVGAL